MLKKATLFIAILITISVASGFQVQINDQEEPATPEKPATVDVQVNNTANEARTYRPDLLNNRYQFLYVSSTPKTIPPKETENFQIQITPGETVVNGNYEYTIKIEEQNTDITRTKASTARITRENDLQLVYINTDQRKYQPSEQINLEAEIRNYGTSRIHDYQIQAEALNTTQEKEGLDINTQAERRYNFEIPTNNQTRPGNHTVQLHVTKDNQKQQIGTQTIQIDEKTVIESRETTENNIISTTQKQEFTNKGNTDAKHEVKTDLNPFLEPITQFNIEPVEKNNSEQTIYTHELDIEPSQTKELEKTTQYWKPASALALLLGLIATITHLREEIKFKKHTKTSEDGIKVQIEIENNSNQEINELEIKDNVPNIAKVNENFPIAKPKVRKKTEGTELTWKIEKLEPQSQRILEYTIQPNVEVEEGVTLPAAQLKQENQQIKETQKTETEFQPR